MSACLPRPVRDLRDDRAVANGKNDGMGSGLRTSAWLPPGLALGWLVVLATFVHSVGNLLAAWAATVSLVLMIARWLPSVTPGGAHKKEGKPARKEGTDGAGQSTHTVGDAATSGTDSS